MKNKFILCLVGCLLAAKLIASSTSVTIASGVMTNLPNVPAGSMRVTQVILSAATTNYSTNFLMIDTYTNWIMFTNSAYTNILSYGTNYVTTWTNYYGRTNNVTNVYVYDATNAVAATTNNFIVPLAAVVNSNSTLQFNSLNTFFVNGMWMSNSGPGSVTATVTYQQ